MNEFKFKNLRSMKRSGVFTIRDEKVLFYSGEEWKQVSEVETLFYSRAILLPQTLINMSQCLLVGGSEDEACTKPSGKVMAVCVDPNTMTTSLQRIKPLIVPRAKVGLCAGQLRS